jgi:hypothetical protein
VSWFDGAGGATPLLVLSAWVAAGLVLVVAGTVVTRQSVDTARPVPAAA